VSLAYRCALAFPHPTGEKQRADLRTLPPTAPSSSRAKRIVTHPSTARSMNLSDSPRLSVHGLADIATAGFEMLTGQPLQSLTDFFTSYKVR
jgi:hypothetical protein